MDRWFKRAFRGRKTLKLSSITRLGATTWIDWVTTPGQENPKISNRLQQLHLVENIQTKLVVLPTLRQTECQIFPMTHML